MDGNVWNCILSTACNRTESHAVAWCCTESHGSAWAFAEMTESCKIAQPQHCQNGCLHLSPQQVLGAKCCGRAKFTRSGRDRQLADRALGRAKPLRPAFPVPPISETSKSDAGTNFVFGRRNWALWEFWEAKQHCSTLTQNRLHDIFAIAMLLFQCLGQC